MMREGKSASHVSIKFETTFAKDDLPKVAGNFNNIYVLYGLYIRRPGSRIGTRMKDVRQKSSVDRTLAAPTLSAVLGATQPSETHLGAIDSGSRICCHPIISKS